MARRDLVAELARDYLRPVRIEIDARGHVSALEGDVAHYGYAALRPGADAGACLLFLEGLPRDAPGDLPMVESPNGRRVHVRTFPRAGGDVLEIVLVDVTEQWRQQQALQQKANELHLLSAEQQKLVTQLERTRDALRESRDEAERASRSKSRFIAKMSHEFRTPLTSILGRARRLADGDGRADDVTAGAAAIERGATHLLNLVENLLDQAQFGEGGVLINPRPADPGALLLGVAELFAPLAAEKGLAFELPDVDALPARVSIDDLRLRQVLINLLGNACKYTSAGSVSVTACHVNDALEIAVSDTGPGIPPADRERVFGAFQRGSAEREQGAGLGLAISRQLVEAMGGALLLESESGQGTTVRMVLPAAAADEPDARPLAPARVLLAEDDRDVADMYGLLLADAGYAVTPVDGGAAAVAAAREPGVALVLMDRNLRDIDGFEATRRLRRAGYAGPVVMLTASNLLEDRDRALAAGCDDFVVKSAGMAQLLDVMTALLQVRA